MKKKLILFGLASLLCCFTPANAAPHGGPHHGPNGPVRHRPAPVMIAPHNHHSGISFGVFSGGYGYYPRQYGSQYFYNYPIVYPMQPAFYQVPYFVDCGSNVMVNFRL